MIARILKSATKFPSIVYSENKVQKGEAVFICAENFPALYTGIDFYESYLLSLSELNANVKNNQFHATISTVERKHSAEELMEIAKKWMNEMGYGDQPYLVYFHGDTGNNHVHIISSRVDKNGNRISPDFENLRSVDAISKIMNEDISYRAEKEFNAILNAFQFSTNAQGCLLFEQKGWKTNVQNGKILLIKNGQVQYSADKSVFDEKVKNYQANDKRQKQLTAIINQYKEGLAVEELKNVLKEKFGIDLILHTSKNHTIPYGYTVIDNANKTVYKGSQIMPIKELLNPVNRDEKISTAKDIFNLFFNDETGLAELRKKMYAAGYKLNFKGEIGLKNEKNPLFKIEDNALKKLRYNDRLNGLKNFKISSEKDAAILAQVFFVKTKDVLNTCQMDNSVISYDTFFDSILYNHLNLEKQLESNNLRLYENNSGIYIINMDEKHIADISHRSELHMRCQMLNDIFVFREKEQSSWLDQFYDSDNLLENGMSVLLALLSSLDSSESEEQNMKENVNEKRKKRNRKR